MEKQDSGTKAIGLIGCGSWGSNILRDLLSLRCQVFVVDISTSARAKAAEKGARKAFSQLKALPECDGFVVAVPIPDLLPTCAALLKYKKPIFSEKTLCRSEEDFKLLKAQGGADHIFAMHKWQYHPGIEALRSVARSKRIGELEALHAVRHGWVTDFHGGDVFWTLAVHDLSIVQHILGHIPKKIKAIQVLENESRLPVAFTALLGDSPAVAISVNGRHCHKRSGVSIHGPKGSAELHHAYDDHITVHDELGEGRVAIDTTFPLFLELKEFVDYLHQGPEPRCDLQSAWEVSRAILALRKKAGLEEISDHAFRKGASG
jgi:predicted dehydrogenase